MIFSLRRAKNCPSSLYVDDLHGVISVGKAYWHSIGTGALGMAGPWNSPTIRDRLPAASARRLIKHTFLSSLLLAFLGGMLSGAYQHFWIGNLGAGDTAAFAYHSVGTVIGGSVASITRFLSLDSYAPIMQDNFLFYVTIPYQLCAFAGAYTTAGGLELLQHFIAMVPTHR
jgi:hypothetical protein